MTDDRSPCQILESVIRRLPYPNQMSEIDVTREPHALSFTWRNQRFRVSSGLSVEEVLRPHVFGGSNVAILLEALLKREDQS